MKKIKWMLLNVSLSILDIASKLKLHSYSDDKGTGFIFEKVRNDEIKGKYVEKITYQDTVPSLYGEQETFERIEYRIVDFYINENSLPIFAIINPPRTLKPFAGSLVKILGLGVSLEEIVIEPMRWVDSIGKLIPVDLVQIELSQIKVDEHAIAKMQVSSSRDLRKYYEKKFKEKTLSSVDRVHISLIGPLYNGKVKITRTGLVVFDTKNEKDLTEILFKALMESYEKS